MTTFTWGVLGAARIARMLIPAIREAGGEVAALGVRDPDSERARAFSREWDVPLVGDYAAVIASGVDVVYNPLPNDLHLPWTLGALRAGKHALTEKPFTLDAAEAAQLAQEAGAAGRTLMEAFAPRFHPYQQRLRELVQGGDLGEIRAIHAASGFALTNPDDFRWDATKGGGALYDVGTYAVNLARLLLGEPEAAAAAARWTEGGPKGGVDVALSGVLTYPHALVTVDTGFDWGERPTQRLTVIGTRGSVDVPRVSGGYTDHVTTLTVTVGGEIRTEDFPPMNAYAAMVAHFMRAARGEEAPLYPPADAVAQARVLDALYAAARTGERVMVER